MFFKISISFFYTQKVAYFVFKDSSSQVKASNFKSHKPDLLTLYRRPNPIKICQTTLYRPPPRCTPAQYTTCGERDHPRHFSNGCKTDPAHHDLSERARPTPEGLLRPNPTCLRAFKSRSRQRTDQPPLSPALEKSTDRQ